MDVTVPAFLSLKTELPILKSESQEGRKAGSGFVWVVRKVLLVLTVLLQSVEVVMIHNAKCKSNL